jgi:hypothetical protein
LLKDARRITIRDLLKKRGRSRINERNAGLLHSGRFEGGEDEDWIEGSTDGGRWRA